MGVEWSCFNRQSLVGCGASLTRECLYLCLRAPSAVWSIIKTRWRSIVGQRWGLSGHRIVVSLSKDYHQWGALIVFRFCQPIAEAPFSNGAIAKEFVMAARCAYCCYRVTVCIWHCLIIHHQIISLAWRRRRRRHALELTNAGRYSHSYSVRLSHVQADTTGAPLVLVSHANTRD